MSTPNGSDSLLCQAKSKSSTLDNESVDNPSSGSHVRSKSTSMNFDNLLGNAPIILDIENFGVYLNKNGPDQDELMELEVKDWNKIKVLTEKLELHGCGEYNLTVAIIRTKHFDSRDKLNELLMQEWHCSKTISFTKKDIIRVIDQITFKKALKDVFGLTINCNMAYYKKHLEEMEKDSGCKFENMNLSSEGLKNLKKKLFFKLSLEVFGDINDEEEKEKSTVIFRDFHLLYDDGNQILATGRRGDRYLLFNYSIS